ncbi:hypothetical protein V8J88_15550 [Massilia sp. W12]|uniref:hypothetical protein n=1 Tax=Massilia sp. W12 TaxID=3126507 RepID=UPI0030D32400
MKYILSTFVFIFLVQAHAASLLNELFAEKRFKQNIMPTVTVPGELGEPADIFLGAWLDDNTLILNNIIPSEQPKWKWKKKVVIWNHEKREVHTLMENAYMQCVNELAGHVKIESDSVSKLYAINVQDLSLDEIVKSEWKKNQCVDFFEVPKEKRGYRLPYHKSYIEFGVSNISGAYRGNAFVVNENGWRKEMDMPANYVEYPTYDRYVNKYWLAVSSYNTSSAPMKKSMLYLVDKEGDVEKIKLPEYYMEEIGLIRKAFFTRKGILIDSSGGRVKSSHYSGLFLLAGNDVIRVYDRDDNVVFIGASPNGCNVAFLELKNYSLSSRKTVKIINFCE